MSDKLPTIDEVLEALTHSHNWEYDCTAYGEGQACCCDKSHNNYSRLVAHLEKLIAAERLKARIDELNHTLITDGSYWSGSREDIRMTRQERIAQLTHQAQAGGEE